jgi:hypothetical protein
LRLPGAGPRVWRGSSWNAPAGQNELPAPERPKRRIIRSLSAPMRDPARRGGRPPRS